MKTFSEHKWRRVIAGSFALHGIMKGNTGNLGDNLNPQEEIDAGVENYEGNAFFDSIIFCCIHYLVTVLLHYICHSLFPQ